MGYSWKTRNVNFNNIFNGMLTLFILSTIEGWPTYMYELIDGYVDGPNLNSN